MFERALGAADVSLWPSVGIGVGFADITVVDTGAVGVGVGAVDIGVGVITTGVSNAAVIVIIIIVDGGAVTAIIDIIGAGPAAVFVRNILPLLPLLLLLPLGMALLLLSEL